MNKLNLGSIQIPINACTKTFAILAKRGAGKTYTGAVMAEEFHKNNIPFVVIDPIDVWWGLRLDKDGKGKGLPVVVFGVQHEDILLNRDMGRKIAQAVVKENVSCVINTFGLPKSAQRHLLAEFADELLNINNTPRHIFIEEAHEFLPQRVFGGLGVVFNAVSNLVVMGRNRGIGVTLINQRAATINKDVLTQLDTLLAFQNTSPQDRKALADWVEYHSAEGDFDKFMKSLPFLPKGEGWIWSPEFLGVFEKIKIRKRETFHPDREKLGDNFVMPELDQVDIQGFISKFSESVKKEQKKEIKSIIQEKVEEKRDSQEIISLRNEYESKLLGKDLEIRKREEIIEQVRRIVGQENPVAHSENMSFSSESNLVLEKMGGMPRKIYETLLKHSNGLTKRQIALMCGYSVTSGSYSNSLSKLRTMGLLSKDGDIYRALLK
ncbi:MAG: DUF87 domain-containing protein [Candidatus Levybacteria bacterium]|nr:DUF87 domain-containing protein [Candidatus Levybacteria bacterium]